MNQTPSPKTFKEHLENPRRKHGLKTRVQVESLIHEFFLNKGYLHTRTPLLVRSPGMEPHIRPIEILSLKNERVFLPTSPEFAMKKLLAGGLEKIYQICPSFRDEPVSPHHHPEFTLLEWYRAYADYFELMNEVETLFSFIAKKLFNRDELHFQGEKIDLRLPWPRKTIASLFKENFNYTLEPDSPKSELVEICNRFSIQTDATDTWDDLFFKLWLNEIEPKFPKNRPLIVYHYPESQAALAKTETDENGKVWARRFEVYIGGLELGNAFEELTDETTQRARFVNDMNLREKIYGEKFLKNPIDEEFLRALREGIPPCSGIAMGVDRIVMLFANERDLDQTIALPSFWPT